MGGVTSVETCLKQPPVESTQSKEISTNKTYVGCPLTQNTNRREISPEINYSEKLYQENTQPETCLRQMPLENGTAFSARDSCLVQRSSRKSVDNEAVVGTNCPIQTYSENRCINEAFLGSTCPRQKSLKNEATTDNFGLKQNVSENNSSTGAVLQNQNPGLMHSGICSTGNKSPKHELPCVTSVSQHKCLGDSSHQNKLLNTASSMHHSRLGAQDFGNVLSNAASSVQHSLRYPSWHNFNIADSSGFLPYKRKSQGKSGIKMNKNISPHLGQI